MHLVLLASNTELLETLTALLAACNPHHTTTTALIKTPGLDLPDTPADALILALDYTPPQPHRFAVALRTKWPQQLLIAIFQHARPHIATLTDLSLNAVFFTWPDPHALERILTLPPMGLFLDATAAAILAHTSHSLLDDVFATLTPRERDVLACLASGASNFAIANTLGVAQSTVRSHLKNLYAKLGATSRSQLIQLGQQLIRSSVSG